MEWAMADRTKDVLSASDAVMEGDEGRIRASRRGIPAPPASSPADGRGAAAPLGYVRIIGNVKAPGPLRPRRPLRMAGLPRGEEFPRGGQSPKDPDLGGQTPPGDQNFPIHGHPFRP